jgi:hypothetical protein
LRRSDARPKPNEFAASFERRKNILKACGFLLLPGVDYVSLRPVSEPEKARKLLKKKYLKHYFKFPGVFHKPVEKPVENFRSGAGNLTKRVHFQHFRNITQGTA